MEKLNILFVEDNPLDAELLIRKIKGGKIDFEFQLVDSLHEVEAALENNTFNFLISDYSLPGFTGIDVIELIKNKDIDIPVILVSGTVPDQTAIDAVLMGAKDYVLKDNLNRLVPAIKRETEALRQREERELNELFVNSLFDSFIGIRISDRNRKIIRVNDRYCEILGYRKGELEGKSLDIVTPKENIEQEYINYEKFFSIGKKGNAVYKEIRKDGSFADVIVSSHVVKKRNEEFIISTFQDVTEALRTNELFEKVSQQANIGGWERDLLNDNLVWTNEVFDIYGIKDGIIPEFDSEEMASHFPDGGMKLLKESFREVINTGNPTEIELEFISKDGEQKWIKNTCAPVVVSGKVVKLFGSFQDITDRKSKEISLVESQEKYQYLYESNPNPLLLIEDNESNRIIGANPAAVNLYGYTESEFLTMTTLDIRPKEDIPFYLDIIKKENKIGAKVSSATTRARHQKKSGEVMEVDIHWKRIDFEKIKSRLVLINDVTEKARNEKELIRTNNILKTLIDSAPIGVITIDKEGIVDDVWNEKAEEIFGWKAEEVFGKFLPFVQEEFVDEVKKKFKREKANVEEIRRVTKAGKLITLKNYLTPIADKDGQVRRILLLLEDITEQTKTKEALIESEQKYRNLVEASHDLIWRIDAKGRFSFVNNASLEILGYEPRELIGKSFVPFVSPDMAEEAFQIHEDVMRGELFDSFDLRMLKKNGSLTFLSAKAYPMYGKNKNVVGCTGTATDVTSLLRYQTQLEESLVEKEVLIKEIHHRVKNNLAVISGLFALQSMNVEDEETIQIFKENQSRIQSIATIHEKLYQNELFTSIEVNSYLTDLLDDIRQTYSRSGKDIEIRLDGEEVTLNVNQAVPFGILANELITNSFKYAFPNTKKGKITLSIKRVGENIFFQVRDNGIGLPENFDTMKRTSLGMSLIQSLSTQLSGEIKWRNDNGTVFELEFKPSKMRTWKDDLKRDL